jgi:YidC/Oxa1 family membrane protein insertase
MKEYLPNPGRYDMRVRVTLKNAADQPRTIRYDIYAAARLTPDVTSEPELQGVLGSQIPNGGIRIVTKSPANVDKEPFQRSNSTEEPLLWGGASERYFAAVLSPVPQSGTTSGIIASATVQFLPQSESVTGSSGRVSRIDNVTVRFTTTERTLKPGQEIVDEYTYFVGPKKQDVLAAHPPLVGLLDYGVFGFISKALLGVLHAFYYVIPNYGIGIILLTIVVKVCLFPVTRKGQISMHKMQRLQPLVKELQEKHKDDRQRQGREMMDLYRKHNANPMSGCWPIFFQLPIFWGLFRMLQYSIDLRQASFLPWWITDLSQPDTVGHIAEFPINILPVLMVISWVVQQWTMPKPADPQQAQMQKMMMFMPVIFGFMLYGMAAGLTLYWLTSTFLGIVEQKLIKHQIQKMEERGQFSALTVEAAQAAKPAGRPKTKRK